MASHTHVPSQSEQGLIPNVSVLQPVQMTVNNTTPSDTLDPQRKKKLIIISVIAIIIIIVVIIIAFIVEFKKHVSEPGYGYPYGDCGCSLVNSSFYPEWDELCGVESNNSVTENKCVDECLSTYIKDDIWNIFYIRNTSQCYCKTVDNYWNCLNISNSSLMSLSIRKWDYLCCVFGRPYNIENKHNLKADIRYVDCDSYTYFDNDDWKEFISNNNYTNNKLANEWMEQGLSEHAAVATFNKFSLQLMSIAAPLWLIQLSNEASVDEVRHTQLSFDMANMYKKMDDNGMKQCVTFGKFVEHSLDIDGDWNKISTDTAIGGCIGETLAAFKMLERTYDNIIDNFVYEMAMDEIKHSALAWITVKWMIDNAENNGINMDVMNRKWWKQQMNKIGEGNKVYNLIVGILDKMWMDYDHKEFYGMVIEELQAHLNMRSAVVCAVN